ncbi:MAG: TolC family protein [Deltaproteobacteria bacterium]|nr:TolC family protein [Deltaproteobacteria bacterium]
MGSVSRSWRRMAVWRLAWIAGVVSGCGGVSAERASMREEAVGGELVVVRGASRASAARGPSERAAIRRAEVILAAGREVSLDQLLAFADRHSPALEAARSERVRSRAERVAASPEVPDEPELEVAAGPRLATGGAGIEVEAGIAQRFEIGGERGRRLAAARRQHAVTEARIADARWIVHCEIHAGFHQALVARERVALARSVLAFQESLVHIVERRLAAGDASTFALRLAQAEVAQARQAVLVAEQELLAVRLALAEVSGWPPARPPMPAGHLDAPRDPPSLETLVATAYRRVPALRARRAAVRASAARVEVADRETWPRPVVGVTYRLEHDPGAGGEATHVVMGAVGLPLPIFRRNRGERARARAELSVAEAELSADERTLTARIARTRGQVVAAARRLRSYGDDILPRFAENLGLLGRAYELGEIDLLELSIGRERFLRIQSDALDAHRDYLVALAALEREVGVDLWHDDHGDHHAGGH